MSVWILLATAVALAMDAFTVAVATAVGLKTVTYRQAFRLAWHFGLFQALMPGAGWILGASVYSVVQAIDHWAAFGLLLAVGGKMILEAAGHRERRIAKQDPTKGSSLIALSVATSIDAFAVGFSLSLLRVSIWWPALVIGITAGLFTMLGMYAGQLVGSNSRLDRHAEILGGVVLIGIGCAILRGHGVF